MNFMKPYAKLGTNSGDCAALGARRVEFDGRTK